MIVVALSTEFDDSNLSLNIPVLFSRVEKLNAAYATQKAISLYAPELIINLGTAGAVSRLPGEILAVNEVTQRDMDASPLSPRSEIPFQDAHRSLQSDFGEFKCVTNDSFVTEVDPWFLESKIEVIDMELYGIAYICNKNLIP